VQSIPELASYLGLGAMKEFSLKMPSIFTLPNQSFTIKFHFSLKLRIEIESEREKEREERERGRKKEKEREKLVKKNR